MSKAHMNGKRAAMALVLALPVSMILCPISAHAQQVVNNPAPVPQEPLAQAPGTPATPAAPQVAAPAQPAAPAVQQPATPVAQEPASPAAAPAPQPAAAPTEVSAAPQPASPAAQKPAAQAKAPAASGPAPTAAEMAIVQNAPILDAVAPASQTVEGQGGMKVTDILAGPAPVRPLPKEYLVVKKDHDGNATDTQLTAARGALWQGRYQAALELFDSLYRGNPKDFRIVMGRAVSLQKLGQDEEAYNAYQQALAIDPKNVEAMTNLLGLVKGHDPATAVTELQALQSAYPANADIAAQLGMVYGVSGDYEHALKYLDTADSLKPGNLTVLYNKAVVYDRMGKALEAADYYHRLLQLAATGDTASTLPLDSVRRRLAVLR